MNEKQAIDRCRSELRGAGWSLSESRHHGGVIVIADKKDQKIILCHPLGKLRTYMAVCRAAGVAA